MSIPTFIFNGGGGGGGSGGPSPSLGSESGKNNNQDIGARTIFTRRAMLRVERVNIDLMRNSTDQGHITIVPGARIPGRLVLSAECYHRGSHPDNAFSFLLDVLLVPIHFNVETCFDLYLDPFIPEPEHWNLGIRSLRDNIILLRRMVVRGAPDELAAEQWDIREDLRNRIDYRLVVTCPVFSCSGDVDDLSVLLLLEMEF
ncbi:hypothetical protein BC827DRAFT_1156336 [Russula dissimulans]|nr:hypothetical protein BC827DRAFT_1156336 [Russula dissimulans]